jgi:hypothetical protein
MNRECFYCGKTMIPGSECASKAQAESCAMLRAPFPSPASTPASPSSASPGAALTDQQAHAIHSHPFVRDALLRYVDRPCDEEAAAIVRVIFNALNGLTLGSPAPAGQAEALIAACVPGGDTCDPQRVADAIREWFAAAPAEHAKGVRVALTDKRIFEIEREVLRSLPSLDGISVSGGYVTALARAIEREVLAATDGECRVAPAAASGDSAGVPNLIALLAEARAAIEPLTGAQIKLHRIKLDLADRIDAALSGAAPSERKSNGD